MLNDHLIAFIYVGSELQCPLPAETMAVSLYPWQLAQERACRRHSGGAQCLLYVFTAMFGSY